MIAPAKNIVRGGTGEQETTGTFTTEDTEEHRER